MDVLKTFHDNAELGALYRSRESYEHIEASWKHGIERAEARADAAEREKQAEKARADAAEREKQAEKARAEAEKARADAAERELEALRAALDAASARRA
jgi:phage-related minor tail protein